MRNNIDIQQTFEAIRKLPIDISLEQVKFWINQEKLPTYRFNKKLNWRLFKWFNN